MRTLIIEDRRTTKRDIFYQCFVDCSSQLEIDKLVSVIVSSLQVPRSLLGIVATSKGLVVGDLKYINSEGVIVDCSLAAGGDSVPQTVLDLHHIETKAKFILVVEKDAIFQRLLEEGVLQSRLPPLIMITGKGVPDLGTRQLVRTLNIRFSLPTFVLTDYDPYGMDIFLIYKFGSLAMTWSAEPLSTPTSVWIGVNSSDMINLDIPQQSTKQFSKHDTKKVEELSKREYLGLDHDNGGLRQELETMWNIGRKAEIQQIMEARDAGFLSHTYLPWKIEKSLWL